MGSGIYALCQNCGYKRNFNLGVGMAYSSLENVIDLVPSKDRELVLDILRNHKVIQCAYWHRLFRCQSCNRLYGRFYVRIEYDNNKVYELKFNCSKCKTELQVVDAVEILENMEDELDEEGLKNYPCPKCGKTELSFHMDILWD